MRNQKGSVDFVMVGVSMWVSMLLMIGFVVTMTGCVVQREVVQYDDKVLQVKLMLHDARIVALENQVSQLNDANELMKFNIEAAEVAIIAANTQLNATLSLIDDLSAEVAAGEVKILKVCSSKEYLIKVPSGVYAVYMISNNLGTYLGQLEENVEYRTTDSVQSRFKISQGVVVCM